MKMYIDGQAMQRAARPFMLFGLLVSFQVHAALPMPGQQTDAWLALQRTGEQASSNPQAASALQREKAAERFLKTYDHPIKESFYGNTFGAGK